MGKIHKGGGGGETSIDGKGVSTDAFSLIMYGFCRNHALYPASLSFIFFQFLLINETIIISNKISAWRGM